MITAIAKLQGTSPYSQSKVITSAKSPKETHNDYELRTWRERLHTDESGNVVIPPTTFKNCLSEAAKYLTKQVPGQGKATYTKHFEAGVMCLDPVPMGLKADEVAGEKLHVPSDGKRGGTKRVWKTFPRIGSGMGSKCDFLHPRSADHRRSFPGASNRSGQLHRHRAFPPSQQRLLRTLCCEGLEVEERRMSMERVPPLSRFEESIQRRMIVDRLRELEENETISYSALSALIGDDVQDSGRHFLASAREKLAREGLIFDAVVNVGIKRLDPVGIVAATDSFLGKSVNAVTRARKTLRVADYERLPEQEKQRYGVAQLRIAVSQQFSRRKALNALKGIVDVQASLPKMRAALAGVLNQFGGN